MIYHNVLCTIRTESFVHQLEVVIITKLHFYYFFVLFNSGTYIVYYVIRNVLDDLMANGNWKE